MALMRVVVLLWLFALGAFAVDQEQTILTLDDDLNPKTTLLQTGEGAVATITASERKEFTAQFLRTASALHATKLRSQVLIDERIADRILEKAGGGGLDLIFRKLEELEKEIKTEQKAADDEMNKERAASAKAIKTENGIISNAMNQRAENTADNRAGQTLIQDWRAAWHKSRGIEVQVHKSLVAMQTRRIDESDIIRGEVDERNKAIAIMT